MLFAKVCESHNMLSFLKSNVCYLGHEGEKGGMDFYNKLLIIFKEIRSKHFENQAQKPVFKTLFH